MQTDNGEAISLCLPACADNPNKSSVIKRELTGTFAACFPIKFKLREHCLSKLELSPVNKHTHLRTFVHTDLTPKEISRETAFVQGHTTSFKFFTQKDRSHISTPYLGSVQVNQDSLL